MRLYSAWLTTATLALGAAAAATPSARSSGSNGGRVATTWYAGWHAEDFPLCDVSWDKYTHVTYAFAETTPDVHTLSLNGSNESLLPEFVKTARRHGTKALVSVGGWTGSRFFSTAVGSAENRTAFVNTVLGLAKKYDLDGIDFDWEYPAAAGIGCNAISPNDTSNFLTFLRELRSTPKGKKLILTAATAISPFIGADGESPSEDVSGFASVLDWIAVMNYDIWGSWSPTVGPNAPLDDSCAPSPDQQAGSATAAVKAWHAAGMPYSQIVLGVPAYGHSFRVRKADAYASSSNSSTSSTHSGRADEVSSKSKKLALYPKFDAEDKPLGDAWDDAAGTDVCGAETGPGGNWDFWALVREGWISAEGKPQRGIDAVWDDCSKTTYVYNATSEVMVSYDDPRSFAAKGAFIKKHNLRGFAMWEAGGDYKDSLLDSIKASAGGM